ncbi:hypothetical protein ECC02_003718 [Trypanosoma cruzi]|uniref:AMMECR1 domain-containing protein n=2 Tax=Trypanosoma cruzi TaxID=5693 RepID=A0A7J6Y924_TRYCR|nr:hypothetical protein ECC02_003718 [Trypanosoma cruzi]
MKRGKNVPGRRIYMNSRKNNKKASTKHNKWMSFLFFQNSFFFFFALEGSKSDLAMVEATPDMAKYCFAVISSKLKNEAIPEAPQSISDDPCPVFVSLKTVDGALRGCIGTFAAEPLRGQLKNYAIAASCEDSRFRPVELSELPSLSCTVYVLHSFEKAANWKDWVIGIHGIRIRYKNYSATYLPSVMSEEGWNHTQTLNHLLRKAGYGGDVTESFLDKVEVTRYQESKASVDFLSIHSGI